METTDPTSSSPTVVRQRLQNVFITCLDSNSSKMGNGMNKILPGLYIGNFRDAKDVDQLKANNITHIVAIHDNAKKILKDKEYLCIEASDSPDQDLSIFFPQVIKFIHRARLDGGGVLVHCLAGVSRSVTITAAYIMTITNLGWRDALNSIRGARSVANPNFGFQKQLQNYDSEHIEEERKKFKAKYPHPSPFNDEEECRINLRSYQHFLMTGNTLARSDDTYPLPHKAYQGSKKEKDSPSSPRDGAKDPGKDNSVKESTNAAPDTPTTAIAESSKRQSVPNLEQEVDNLFLSGQHSSSGAQQEAKQDAQS